MKPGPPVASLSASGLPYPRAIAFLPVPSRWSFPRSLHPYLCPPRPPFSPHRSLFDTPAIIPSDSLHNPRAEVPPQEARTLRVSRPTERRSPRDHRTRPIKPWEANADAGSPRVGPSSRPSSPPLLCLSLSDRSYQNTQGPDLCQAFLSP